MKFPDVDYTNCPANLVGGLTRYIEERIAPGHFLRAALENDFVQVINRADSVNFEQLGAVASFLYNELPDVAWGSKEKVAKWLAGDCSHGVSKVDRCFDCDPNTGVEGRC